MKKLKIALILLFCFFIVGCGQKKESVLVDNEFVLGKTKETEICKNKYAEGFTIARYSKGYSVITVGDGRKYLLVPEGENYPSDYKNYITIKKPLDKIYLASTSAMSLFDSIGCVDNISYSSLKKEDWCVENAVTAMNDGDIIFAGKYSAPDFELLLSNGCNAAIESTMILHSPEIMEKLEELGIPVIVERSSYEKDPLGRLEWIKVFGELCGEYEEASEYFDEQEKLINNLNRHEENKKTVAFFYINQNGQVVTKKSNDYVPKMIEMAGGKYIFDNLGTEDESALSTINMTMEEFYIGAKDADIIIYNSTIQSAPQSVEELIEKNPLLSDFKAVKEGKVWCSTKSMHQSVNKIGEMICDINRLFSVQDYSSEFIYKLN